VGQNGKLNVPLLIHI